MWVEEPIPSDDVDAMLRVRNNTHVPIAAGENIYSRFGYRRSWKKKRSASSSRTCRRPAACWSRAGSRRWPRCIPFPVAPHGVASPLATMAYAHVCATMPNFMILEWTYYLNKEYTSLVEPVTLTDGFLHVSDKPGIGITLNDAAVKERTDAGYKPL